MVSAKTLACVMLAAVFAKAANGKRAECNLDDVKRASTPQHVPESSTVKPHVGDYRRSRMKNLALELEVMLGSDARTLSRTL